MKSVSFVAGLGVALANPMTIVLDELAKLIDENTVNLKDMEVNFAAESTQCKMDLAQTADRIASGKSSIESLTAKRNSHRSSQAGAQTEVDKTTQEINQLEADLKGYKDELAAKRAEFAAASDQLAFTIGQIQKAIDTMQAKAQDIPAALVQLSSSTMIPEKARKHIDAFLQTSQAPQATSYEFEHSSGSVIDMLKGLLASFKTQQHEQDAEAINNKHNYAILIQNTINEIDGSSSYLQDKKDQAATHGAKAGAAEADRTAAEAALKEDQTFLADRQRACTKAAAEYKADVKVMTAEIEACKTVQGILSDGGAAAYEASGANTDGALDQSAKLTSFLQQSSRSSMSSENIVDMLRAAGEKLQSKTLNLAATRIAMLEQSAGKMVSFEAINNMIRDLISKLEEEAAVEAQQHEKCEGAKEINKANTEASVRNLEKLEADKDSQTAAVSKNKATAEEMTEAIKEISTQRSTAEEERANEKTVNERIIAEATAAESALAKARSVVDEFMGADIGVATRGPSPAMDKIATLLETIQEKSSGTLVKTKQMEEDAAKDHKQFMVDSELALETSKERKSISETNVAKFTAELEKTSEALAEETAMHKSLVDELAQITQLCNPSLSPEERQKKRAEEIENLQNALKAIEPRLD